MTTTCQISVWERGGWGAHPCGRPITDAERAMCGVHSRAAIYAAEKKAEGARKRVQEREDRDRLDHLAKVVRATTGVQSFYSGGEPLLKLSLPEAEKLIAYLEGIHV